MQINLARHPDLLRGVWSCTGEHDQLLCRRMNDGLAALYAADREMAVRASTTAGVRLRVETDSPYVELTLQSKRRSRPIFAADVVVDDLQLLSFATPDEQLAIRIDAPASGMHRYEIFLPQHVECLVGGFTLADGAHWRSAEYAVPGRIAFLGDSITQGVLATTPARSYVARLARRLQSDFINLGVGGATMCAAVGNEALHYQWDSAFVAYGINDCAQSRPLERFAAETRGMLDALTSRAGAPITMLLPIPWPDGKVNALGLNLEDYRNQLRVCAEDYPGIQVVDGYQLLSADPLYYADGCHPNDRGMEIMADHLFRFAIR